MPATETISDPSVVRIDDFYAPWEKQRLLHVNQAKNLLAIGGNGGGKSAFLLGEAIYNAFEYPGSNILLLRRDYPELEKGLILDFKTTVPKHLYRYNDQKHIVSIPIIVTNAQGKEELVNSLIFFGHLQNGSERSLSQYLSSAFVFIGIDELGQFSFEAYDFLRSRNRVNKGCRPNAKGYMPYCRMGAATNPLGPGYPWIKSMWIDHKPLLQLGKLERDKKDGIYYAETHGQRIKAYDPKEYFHVHSTVLDNPAQLQKDPDYINKLASLSPALRQKALYGDLNAITGAYFSNLNYDQHILSLPRDRERIEFQHWQPIWLGIDWGLAHHSAVYWMTRAIVKGIDDIPRNKVVIYRELFINETNVRDLCRMIVDMTPDSVPEEYRVLPNTRVLPERQRVHHIFLSPERFNRSDNVDANHTVADQMGDEFRLVGFPRPGRANNRRVDGAVFMYNLLARGELVFIEEGCPQLISALQTRVRDDLNLEDVLKVEDVGDDCYDAARYGLLSMLGERNKPEDVKLAEKLRTIPDHTARMLFAYEQMNKQNGRRPIKPVIVPRWQAGR